MTTTKEVLGQFEGKVCLKVAFQMLELFPKQELNLKDEQVLRSALEGDSEAHREDFGNEIPYQSELINWK